jgi:acyl-CoA thioester hydrolase
MARPHVAVERIRWADVDLVGIARFSAFTRFVEYAEQEWMRDAGLPYDRFFGAPDFILPRRQLALEYLAPSRLDDALATVTYVPRVGETSLTIAVDLYGVATDDLRVAASMVVVCVDRASFAKRPLPGWLSDAMQPYLMDQATARDASGPARRALAEGPLPSRP